MIILGIDPGTATTGFGLIDYHRGQGKLIDFGVISTKPGLSDAERLAILAEDLLGLIKKFNPQAAGVEKLFFTSNQKTVMAVAQARGVALLVCQNAGVPLVECTPLQVKNFICGFGRADKKQVQFMVQKTFGLKKPPRPDDAADALAIALYAAHGFSRHQKFLK